MGEIFFVQLRGVVKGQVNTGSSDIEYPVTPL